jgi:hypothetical protein
MQTQEPRFIPDPATIWWGPTFRAAQTLREMPVALPRAQIKTALALAVLSLIVSLFGPAAWWHASRELQRIRNGDADGAGSGWLQLAMVIGVFATFWFVTIFFIAFAMLTGH